MILLQKIIFDDSCDNNYDVNESLSSALLLCPCQHYVEYPHATKVRNLGFNILNNQYRNCDNCCPPAGWLQVTFSYI